MKPLYSNLNPEKALIWRIVHRDNLPWILDNGLHCSNSSTQFDAYVSIGAADLIVRRRAREVPIYPYGTLADYIPFYFTPFSIMLKNIRSGRGVTKRSNEEIVILVSSLHKAQAKKLPFVFTNSHAYSNLAKYFSAIEDLTEIDWGIIQRRDFKRNEDSDPTKLERYQAEALIYQHIAVDGLLGLVCYSEASKALIETEIQCRRLSLPVYVRPDWYFP